MTKFITMICAAISLVAGCAADDESYLKIDGTIDPSFDGYNIYFRPQPFPTGDIVDSCRIKGGRFSFRIAADSLYMGDLVLSYSSRKRVEPILLAVESGHLTVEMGTDSKSYGTPLNDTLAQWKKFIEENVQNKRNEELIEASRLFEKRAVELIKNHRDAFGGYLFFIYSPSFSASTVSELDSLKFYNYMPDVSKRPFKFSR